METQPSLHVETISPRVTPRGFTTEIPAFQEESASTASLELSRRTFVKILGTGILISVLSESAPAQRGGFAGSGAATISARVHITKDGTITVMTGKVECGQGARAEITQTAADELRVAADALILIMSDTALVPDDGMTAGSRTTPSTLPAIRRGCAAARELFLAWAAKKWGVDPTAITMTNGQARHAATDRQLSYADLAADQENALQQGIPANVAMTAVADWKVQGTSVPRPNRRDLVTGAHRYPADQILPGMLYAKILRAPSWGAKLKSIDLAPARAMKDVLVHQDGDFVGIAAPTSFLAQKALEAIAATATWDAISQPSSTEIYDYFRTHTRGQVQPNPNSAEMAAAAKTLKQSYHIPYAAHAPMEPRAAAAQFENGKMTVWTGTQNPFGSISPIAQAAGLQPDSVHVIVPDFGGGFGGKHQPDAGVEAARLAKAFQKPILLRWSREEEFTWAYFRPAAVMDIEASLDPAGKITSWHHNVYNAGSPGLDTPYQTGKRHTQAINTETPLRQGSYRGLGAVANFFARESAMDELAALAGQDPLAFRLAHLEPGRLRTVLETLAQRFDWQNRIKQKSPNVGLGLACGAEKGSFVAACVEIAINDKQIIVRKVAEVFECGAVVNPEGLTSQIQGSIIMGLGPALREEIIFEKGIIANPSFAAYPIPRYRDLPEIDAFALNRPEQLIAGAGETPIMPIAPAIANALFNATGQRTRQMPIRVT